jgi:hypothetical protein
LGQVGFPFFWEGLFFSNMASQQVSKNENRMKREHFPVFPLTFC